MTEQLYELDGGSDVHEDTRAANDRIASSAKRLHFVSRIPFICECDDRRCRATVLLHESEYAERRQTGRPVALAGHTTDRS